MAKTAFAESGNGALSRRRLNFNISSNTRWLRNGIAKLAQRPKVSFDCFPNITFRVFKSDAGCDAARQVRNVRSPIALRLLENNRARFDACGANHWRMNCFLSL